MVSCPESFVSKRPYLEDLSLNEWTHSVLLGGSSKLHITLPADMVAFIQEYPCPNYVACVNNNYLPQVEKSAVAVARKCHLLSEFLYTIFIFLIRDWALLEMLFVGERETSIVQFGQAVSQFVLGYNFLTFAVRILY